jgi:probable F420-dependent oxidoreductase
VSESAAGRPGRGVRVGVSLVPDPLDPLGMDLTCLPGLARRAEALGFDRVAVSDHLLFHVPTPEPLVCLAAMAEATTRVRLATAVLLLPLRHPLQVAQAVASVDQLSAGRVELGVGVGGEWPADYHALGVDPRRRGRRADEALAILRALWAGGPVDAPGPEFPLAGVLLPLLPKQRPGPPIVVGGRSEAALRRAARFGERWDGIFLSPPQFAARRARLEELASAEGRVVSSGLVAWAAVGEPAAARQALAARLQAFYRLPFERFERSSLFGPPEALAEQLAAFVEAGATDLTLIVPASDPRHLEALAPVVEALDPVA